MSSIEKLSVIDVEESLKTQHKALETLQMPDGDTMAIWNNPLINCNLKDCMSFLIDDEVIELLKEFAEVQSQVDEGKEVIKDYARQIEKSIQDIKSIYRSRILTL